MLQLGPYPPPRGGVQTNMLAIRDELLAGGHECSIISITRSESADGEESNVYHPRGAASLLRLVRTLRYDVLHLHIGGGLPRRVQLLILACGLFAGGRTVLTFHSGGYAVSPEGRKGGYLTLRGFAFRRFGAIIVVNRSMIPMFERFGVRRERIRLIRPFVLERPRADVEIPGRFADFLGRHGKVLITVGLLEEDYDLPLQIEVLGRVRRRFPDAGLIIIGAGSLEDELHGLIAAQPYADHVLLAGDTDRGVVLHLIERADLMLRTTVFDGDAISVREALFLGTPVVATDNGMRPGGPRLIPVRDADALERAVCEELARETRPAPAGGSGEDNIRRVVGVYEELLDSE